MIESIKLDNLNENQLFTEKYLRSRSKSFLLYQNMFPKSNPAFRASIRTERTSENVIQNAETFVNLNKDTIKFKKKHLKEILKKFGVDALSAWKKLQLMEKVLQ